MHILVTGGTVFLGGRLIAQLARDCHQVFALTRSSASHAKLRALGASPVGLKRQDVPYKCLLTSDRS